MISQQGSNYVELNQRYLLAEVNRVKKLVEQSVDRHNERTGHVDVQSEHDHELEKLRDMMDAPPYLDILCCIFGLSRFERDLILLCAGIELDSAFVSLVEKSVRSYANFSLALASLSEPHWSALSPASPLRYWRLIELLDPRSLTDSQLRIDECVLHYLTGLGYFDERLSGYIRPAPLRGHLVPSHRKIVEKAAATGNLNVDGEERQLLQFYGTGGSSQLAIASSLCDALGLNLMMMGASTIPRDRRESDALSRLLDRQAKLTRGALLLELPDARSEDREVQEAVSRFVSNTHTLLILTGRERSIFPGRASFSFEVRKPSAEEQLAYWKNCLHGEVMSDAELGGIVSQFNLDTGSINSVYSECAQTTGSMGQESFADSIWDCCRAQARRNLADLAQRVIPAAAWKDLVLPDAAMQALKEITVQVRQRFKVYATWGFSSRIPRGLGIAALFSGPSGTGKTMASEVLASELKLDLYRIDLSQVVSKYIGETEKNLRRIFDAAEDGGAILLFDEADALFGKRSEVKDSHDRYANIEISYLLQRMEDYRGLAILTTNMKEALDSAFLRRLRFVVQFPFPGVAERKEIWDGIFPADTPTRNLDVEKLAKLNVSGGNIRNIAMHAAFLAAGSDEPVSMKQILRAARVEYAKLETSLTDAEVKGWA